MQDQLEKALEAKASMEKLSGQVFSASYGGVMVRLDNGLKGQPSKLM